MISLAVTYMLDNGQDVDDLSVDGLTVGDDVTDAVEVIVRLDRQMCIAQVVVGIPVCVWLHGSTVLIHTQLTHTSHNNIQLEVIIFDFSESFDFDNVLSKRKRTIVTFINMHFSFSVH